MANIGGEEDFVFAFPRNDQFTVSQGARFKGTTDEYPVLAGLQALALAMG